MGPENKLAVSFIPAKNPMKYVDFDNYCSLRKYYFKVTLD